MARSARDLRQLELDLAALPTVGCERRVRDGVPGEAFRISLSCHVGMSCEIRGRAGPRGWLTCPSGCRAACAAPVQTITPGLTKTYFPCFQLACISYAVGMRETGRVARPRAYQFPSRPRAGRSTRRPGSRGGWPAPGSSTRARDTRSAIMRTRRGTARRTAGASRPWPPRTAGSNRSSS